jgi:hypothetical protein
MSEDLRLKTWLACLGGLGILAAVVPLLCAWQHLPEPLAHFDASGVGNGQISRSALLALQASQVLLVTVLTWPRRRALPLAAVVAPARIAALGFVSTLGAVQGLLVIWRNWDRGLWQDAAPLNAPLLLLLLLGLPALVAGALLLLARRWWPPLRNAEAPPDALPLADGERAYWSGTASNGWLSLIALLVVIEGGLLQLTLAKVSGVSRPVLALHLLILVALELCSKIRVTVNERELTIRYGRLGWLRQRVAIERVLAATVFELDPWAHRGWGYRGSLRLLGKVAIVVRAGSALRLDLRDGKCLSVTVDDADTAARLVNGFVQRRGPSAPRAVLQPSPAR